MVNSKFRCRFSGLCLAAAVGMLGVGETWLKHRLSGAVFVTYWLVCFALTGLAAILALRDLSRVRMENRAHQKALIESTLQQIERKTNSGSGGNSSARP